MDVIKTEAEIAKITTVTAELNAEMEKMIREPVLYQFLVGFTWAGALIVAAKLFF